ncbi:hypothetical protein GCM10010435_75370 [Winogradskya consettensis]|uniref:Barstar (barnase inhibitor) domain-containing protein n=1 Tax=Winogradskya consettensis TaxID=113560 RepID=A0A919T0G4_9ACTN|nr:barstar family protein [Actinoplanes consettensis]GIM81156.1 hypothetical protein Aco04nite_75150 [Actinoplanes consettensis]
MTLPRWSLAGTDDVLLAVCADIDGLFADLPPRPRERFTLLGCEPAGALREGAWLGNVWLLARPDHAAMLRDWGGEQLVDTAVLGHRPSAGSPGLVDVDLEGLVSVYDRTDNVDRPDDVTGFVLYGSGDSLLGSCADVTGVFRERAAPPIPQVTLIGCRAGETLKVGQRISGKVGAIAADGSAIGLIDSWVTGTIVASVPSADGLLKITVDSDSHEPSPTGLRDIVDIWRAGRPTENNLWAGYDRDLREEWAGVALANHPGAAKKEPFDLDGRFVTDVEGFYCALGEAVNGPGGYFGWNLDALEDCLRGRWGAQPPFRLRWHDSAVAREHLVAGYDRHRSSPTVTLDYLLETFAEHGVDVDLR